MAVAVVLPGPLTQDAGGRSRVEVPTPNTVAEVLQAVFTRFPRLRDRILTEQGDVRPHVNVFVGNRSIRTTGGLATAIRDGSEIFVLPAISGGAA